MRSRAPGELALSFCGRTWRERCLILLSRMKYCLALLLAAAAIPGLHAAEKLYQTGKIVDIQRKANTRILYYQVDTPITRDEPYYEVSVQVGDRVYVGDYSPRHSAETLPEEWNAPQAEVRLRLEKHYMFLMRPAGTELQFVIAKSFVAAAAQKIPESPSQKK
jgi:hypothetical protein